MSNQAQFDWNHLRTFLAVADTGSLTGASRSLSTSQPTLSRHIAELESSLGVALFERVARGLRLTESGKALLEPARQMQKNAELFSLKALGQTQQLAGTIRLTASEILSGHILPPILAKLRRTHPEIQIELLATDQIVNILERHADIAIRHTQPQQADLIAKKLGDAKIGLFAHRDYLHRTEGQPITENPEKHDWIGLDQSDLYLKEFRKAGKMVDREFFSFRCDNVMVGWQAALAGLGIAPTFFSVAQQWPEMQLFCPESSVSEIPLWLVSHRELLDNPRVRVVFDALAEGLQDMVSH